MATKRVTVASTDSRKFVEALLELGAQGATLPIDSGVFKGIMLRTAVELPEDVAVTETPVVKVSPQEIEKRPVKAVINTKLETPKEETKPVAKRGRRAAAKDGVVEGKDSTEEDKAGD